jgi:restriction endonuclease S subunit
MATLSNMIILIPSIVEQATISEFVENLSKKILFVSQQKKSTVAWKK